MLRPVAAILPWLQQHWFDLVQSLGIIASMAFTAASLRRERHGRRMTDHLTLAAQHRELWIDANRRPELARILLPEVDLVARPISLVEEDYLNLVIVHYTTGWLMAREGGLVNLKVLAKDARAFFGLPIPRAVWEQTAPVLDPEFAAFIREALAHPRPSWLTRSKRAVRVLWKFARRIGSGQWRVVMKGLTRAIRLLRQIWIRAKRTCSRSFRQIRSGFS